MEIPLRPDMQFSKGDPSLRAAAEEAMGKGLLSGGNTGTLLNVASWSQGYIYREQLGKLGVSFACWLRAREWGGLVVAVHLSRLAVADRNSRRWSLGVDSRTGKRTGWGCWKLPVGDHRPWLQPG